MWFTPAATASRSTAIATSTSPGGPRCLLNTLFGWNSRRKKLKPVNFRFGGGLQRAVKLWIHRSPIVACGRHNVDVAQASIRSKILFAAFPLIISARSAAQQSGSPGRRNELNEEHTSVPRLRCNRWFGSAHRAHFLPVMASASTLSLWRAEVRYQAHPVRQARSLKRGFRQGVVPGHMRMQRSPQEPAPGRWLDVGSLIPAAPTIRSCLELARLPPGP